MKTLLLIVKKVMTKGQKLFSATVLLLILLGITQSTHAQVYYLINSTTGNTTNAANALKKVDYNGSNDGNITTGIPNPILAEVDAPNNRIFTYNGFLGSRVINVVNMSTGVVTNTITLPAGIQVSGPSVTAIKYDPINDWVYYVTNSNGGSATLNAIYRSKPDGNQNTVLATGIATLPQWLALDIPNNRVFIYEGVFSGRKILTFDLGTNTVTGNAPVTNIANAIAYDPLTDYLYYITSDNDPLNVTGNDALRKIHPGGAGGEVVVKSSVVKCPQYMTLDAGNNRAFVYEGYYGTSTTIRLDDTGIYTVDLTTGSTTRILDHSGLQNTPNYLRVYALFAPARPIVSTTAVSTFSSGSATLGGNATRSDASVTERGVVYSSSNTTPIIGGSGVTKATNGTGTGSFSASISGLSASTTYYVRGYAISGAGTSYGAVTTFATLSNDATLSAFSISAGTLTPVFSSASISYTASVANANSTITVTPTKNNTNASIKVNNVVVNSGSASGAINLNIGDNVITTIVTAQDGTTTKTYTLTVTRPKAAQTITFNTIPTKTYGDADFAPGASASSGLGISYSSDNLSVATIVSGQIHIVGVGTANITASQAGDGNYLSATNVAQVLTVNKASQIITFNAIPAKTYGDADFAPGATASSGLTVSYSSDNSLVATIVSNQIHIVGQGTANITASQAGDGNRLAATNVAQLLTVNKATITVTAAAKTKVYGDNDPAFTYSATGVFNGDAPTGALTRASGRFIGDYAINQGNVSYGSNYNITYIGANLTITKRPITIKPSNQTKVYGAVEPNYPYQLIGGIAPEDAMTGTFIRTDGEQVGDHSIPIGTKRPIDPSTSLSTASNYDITFIPGVLTITAKPVTVTAIAQTKNYSASDPILTYNNTGLAFSDTFTGTLTRDPGEGVGTYAITQGTLALSSNYTLSFNGNSLTIGKKTINVTANAANKTYGAADPAFTYSNDALAFSDTFTGSLTRDAGEGVGTYAITQGSLALNSNYTLNYTSANLSIGKANLTYVATPASRPFQSANPTFTGSVTGFVSGDSQALATSGTLSFTSTATVSSVIGSYPILGSGLSAANYDFVQASANSTALTITQSNDATLAGLTVDQGTLAPAFSSGQESYSANVDNGITSFNLSATANQQDASIKVNGSALTSGGSKNIALQAGNNIINVVVTAQDGVATKNYQLSVFRAYSTNNLLASLSLSGITFSPVFNTNTLSYTASVGNLVTSTDVNAATADGTAKVYVLGNNIAQTGPVNFPLVVGENAIPIVSIAESGAERIYTVTVTRAQSADATLASIGNSSITLNTPFVSGTHTYTATVASGIGALTFLPIATNNAAVIKVNNQALNTGSGNNVSLAFGTNSVVIDVTSEDGLNHIPYVLNIYRLRSSDAALASLSFPFITSLNEEFNPNVYEYTATVADSTYTGIPLSAVSANENAVVKIDGTVVPRFVNYTLPVHGGPNTYHIVVTSQDTSATKTYTLVLTRAGQAPPTQSPIANLLALNISSGSSFSKNFNFSTGDVLTTINAPNNIESVRIFPVSENEVSTITINGVTLPYDTTTGLLPISVGDNIFTIVVTSEDGAHTKTYDVHINRLPFTDVSLASLAINTGALTPAFNSATKTYSVSVPNTVTSIVVTPVATVNTATIMVGATAISPSNPTATFNLSEGLPNNIRVVVTAADGITKQTYTISVTRLPSNNANVSLALNTGTLLVKTTGTSTYNYTASVSAEVTSVRLRTIAQANAVIKVNGNVVTSGVLSDPIALGVDPTVINVSVTAQDGVTVNTYSIIINHAGSNNANASLVLNPAATLMSTTGTSTYNYTASVPAEVSSIRLKTTAQQANAVIKVNGNAVASGALSDPIALSTEPTIINVSVTAQDGVTINTYSIAVNHIISSNANVSLVLNPSATLMSITGTSTYNYKTSVSADVSSISLKATAQQTDAVIKVNGNVVTSGAFSDPITISTDPTIINVSVTAQDGVTVNTYSITVNRTGSNNANVSLALNPSATLMSITGTSTYNYKTSVSSDVSSIRLKATAQQADAVIKINGNVVTSGAFSDPIALIADPTVINVSVTAQDGVTVNTYSITVNRTGSNNANVSLTLNPVSTLMTTTGTSTYNYTTSVSAGVSSVRLKTVAQQADAVIKVNGNIVNSGVLSSPIALVTDPTIINVSVTAQDGVTVNTYSITVNRTGSSNVLANLVLNPATTLTAAATGPGNVNYTATVSEGQSTIRMIPTVYDNATVTVNGTTVTSGTASDPIALTAGGSTLITAVVTAENGTTVKTYTVNVTRPSSMLMVDRNDSKLLFANKTSNNVAPTNDDGVIVHQGVSPNGDGSNDFLYIEGISAYAGNKLSIMNTGGALVFETKDYGKDSNHLFDGHSNKTGTLLKPGTYFYALEYQVDKQSKRKTGYIIIKY